MRNLVHKVCDEIGILSKLIRAISNGYSELEVNFRNTAIRSGEIKYLIMQVVNNSMVSILSELNDEGFILPDFKNSNFKASKQIGDGNNRGVVGNNSRKIFILLDGLGYDLLEKITAKFKELRKNMEKFENKKVTTLFPSTTMNILSSIYGGVTPAEHGVVGSNLFIKEAGVIINCIYLTSAMDSMGPRLKNLKRLGLKVSFGKHIEETDDFGSSSINSRMSDICSLLLLQLP